MTRPVPETEIPRFPEAAAPDAEVIPVTAGKNWPLAGDVIQINTSNKLEMKNRASHGLARCDGGWFTGISALPLVCGKCETNIQGYDDRDFAQTI